jgi:hypothetical protein
LLVLAEVIVHRQLRVLVRELTARDLVAAEDRATFDACIDRAMRLRNSPAAEALLLVIAFTVGHWLWRRYTCLPVASWYVVPEGGSWQLTESGYWLAFVSLPISRFLLLRWYFRLLVWYQFLWRVSRLRLRLNALHADRAGGLGFLGHSAMAFSAVLVAQSAYVAMVLGDRIWHQGARLSDFRYEIAAVVVCLSLLVLLPMCFFAAQLFEARLGGTIRFGRLASRYTNEFRAKWLAASGGGGDLLGTPDIQSLADLGVSCEVVQTMRLLPFDTLVVVRLAVTVAAPFLPLMLTVVPLDQILSVLANVIV